MIKKCIKCKVEFEEATDIGRTKKYCSMACKRSAELEVRRINERLSSLEKIAEAYRLKTPMLDIYGSEEAVLAEVELQEQRFKKLLDGMSDC